MVTYILVKFGRSANDSIISTLELLIVLQVRERKKGGKEGEEEGREGGRGRREGRREGEREGGRKRGR